MVLREVPKECRPSEGMYYYKRHSEHADFTKGTAGNKEQNSSTGNAVAKGTEHTSEAEKTGMEGSKWSN